MKKLSKEQILMLHSQLIEEFGGNKRIGAHAMLVFLAINGIELDYTQKELYEMILSIADGSLEYENLFKWVLEHQV